MKRFYLFYAFLVFFFGSCTNKVTSVSDKDSVVVFKYAKNIQMTYIKSGIKVTLINPWKSNATLHTYYLVKNRADATFGEDGTIIQIPLKRSLFFTTAHANLMTMLGCEDVIAGVADAKYMLIPKVQTGIKAGKIADCGESMKPNIEKIIDLSPDALFLSPFENSGGYGKLDQLNIPIIECAEYMESSALGRAEWMKFYGVLFGRERTADSLFSVVEKDYLNLKKEAETAKETRSVLPDRKVGAVWYLPGGKSSVGRLYADAKGSYAYAVDTQSGSLAVAFETVLNKFENSDFWIFNHFGSINRKTLLAEYQGYAMLRPFKEKEIYGCQTDKQSYFEEVSWRPDWLLSDLIQLFHPDLKRRPLRYYKKITD